MAIDSPIYTQIPNQLLGNILKGNIVQAGMLADMGLAELKVFLTVCRLTFGYHQNERRASLTTLQKLTGLSRQGVLDGAAEAEKREIIERVQDGGVTLWCVLVKPVDQVVKPVDQSGQASRPPSKKETRNKPKKETKERGAAEKTPPASTGDYLTDLFVGNTKDTGLREGERLIQIANWDIRSPEHRQAMAAFLEASRLPIPPDKTRKDWIKSIDIHVQTYGATELENMYPRIVAQMRGDDLTVSRPGSVTNNLADYWAKERNGGKPNAQPAHPQQLTEHQKRIAEAFESNPRNPGG